MERWTQVENMQCSSEGRFLLVADVEACKVDFPMKSKVVIAIEEDVVGVFFRATS